MFLTTLTPKHFQSPFCIFQASRQAHLHSHIACSLLADELVPFCIGDKSIDFVSDFCYLGRILSKDDSDDMAAYARLKKAWCTWGQFKSLLQADGASVETMGRFY